MGNLNRVFAAATFVLSSGFMTMAQAQAPSAKPADLPACTSIVGQCEKAGFEPGDHKKTGKGLWVDCVHKVAKGTAIAGVTATPAEAKSCQDAAKEVRKEKKAAKGK
ncbi:hypothetical protein BH10BDE1_BH10BDE1_14950 [soil metagenome]